MSWTLSSATREAVSAGIFFINNACIAKIGTFLTSACKVVFSVMKIITPIVPSTAFCFRR